jgi:DNA-binding LacI/PurR family transcriptional regulator
MKPSAKKKVARKTPGRPRNRSPAARKPTISDVARVAGVSKSTVSLVVRNNPIVSDGARSRVVEAMKAVGYVYNRGAANLRLACSNIIGVIVNDLTNNFFAELAVGMDMIVQSAGFVQLMANTGENVGRQREVIASMREHGVSGLIIAPARDTRASDLKVLTDSQMPTVIAIRDVPGLRTTRVVPDNLKGAYEASQHLLQLGYDRIGFLGGFPEASTFQNRVQGLRDALGKSGLELDERFIVPSSGSRAGGSLAMQRLLSLPDRPTACLCVNDAVALGACDELRRAGIEPGREFGLIGFDDIMEACSVVPALTTVALDPQQLGRRIAQLLLRQVSAGRVEQELITTPVRLVVRESCGAPWRARRVREAAQPDSAIP